VRGKLESKARTVGKFATTSKRGENSLERWGGEPPLEYWGAQKWLECLITVLPSRIGDTEGNRAKVLKRGEDCQTARKKRNKLKRIPGKRKNGGV